ncbi:hypothetical protein [Polaromonas eurypsychrophila]|uniref:hypothetical protein n=1 Tax=Polaromonas eurypsychrophila TaxID=1614635 RepID=UPI00166CB60A|nr:hypothetical protein [Polaromonas eurypsychrophila]
MAALAFVLIQVVLTLILVGIFLWIRSLFRLDPPRIRLDGLSSYEVFQRKGKWSALLSEQSFQLRPALFYAGFFYVWVPVLIYRYGWKKAVFLVALPFAGIPIGALFASYYDWPDARIFVGMMLVIILRSMLSIQVGISSTGWMREAKINRGWVPVGQCSAVASTEAIRIFIPAAPNSKNINFVKRLRKLLASAQLVFTRR